LLNILFLLIIIVLGLKVSNLFKTHLSVKDIKVLKRLWFYHLAFSIVFWLYIQYGPGGDAYWYWINSSKMSLEDALEGFFKSGPGTYAMFLLNLFPAKVLSFFGLSMLYSFLGYIGMICFYVLFKNNIVYNSKLKSSTLFPLIFFLPNLHFWSAGVGKDTLLFLCIGLFLYGMQRPAKHIGKLALALVLSYLIRPHITIFLIASFGLAFVLDGKLKSYQKIFFFLIFLGGFIAMFDNIMAFLKLESLDAEEVGKFTSSRVSNLSRDSTSSSIDISNYPLPLKMFTFLYRPLFFDINGVLAIIASFENLLLLVLSWKFIRLNPIKVFKAGDYLVKAMFLFVLMGTVSFSLILGNLGIMLRQKNMFIPALLFICLWGFSYNIQEKHKRRTRNRG